MSYLGRRHDLIGQETTGIGGMSSALRTIPVMIEIAQKISQYAPQAWMINFTNPAGLITEALTRWFPEIKTVGMCNVAITTKMYLLKLLEKQTGLSLNPNEVTLDTLGLNHLTWHRGLRMDGEDYWPQALESYINDLKIQAEPEWPPKLIETMGLIPNYYLDYFYNHAKKLIAQRTWPPSRAEEVMTIEAKLLKKYANPSLVELPDELLERGGAFYSTMAVQLLNAIHNDLGKIQVLNVPNNGAVSVWPDDWVLELPCRVGLDGIYPLPTKPLPSICGGLIAQVKAYELLTVEAAIQGDRSKAFQALIAHPLGPDIDKTESVLEDMLQTHKEYLPHFWNENDIG
jgi:6-phospho-beta-glucosidase